MNIEEAREIAKETVKVFEEKPTLDYAAFEAAKNQLNKLLFDFENFYGPKGRGIDIIIRIRKKGATDSFKEKYVFNDYNVISAIEIDSEKIKEEDFEGLGLDDL